MRALKEALLLLEAIFLLYMMQKIKRNHSMHPSAVSAISGNFRPTRQIEIKRVFLGSLPFIADSQEPVTLALEQTDGGWVGVNCVHSSERPSPHLTTSHIESAAHVFGDGVGVEEVFSRNPHYKEKMRAVHVKVLPESLAIEYIRESKGISTVVFSSGDTYQMINKSSADFSLDRVVTKAALEKALWSFEDVSVALIEFEGAEESIAAWPYMSNEAVDFLVQRGVKIVGLNIPSMDRETDGGMTSNHKVVFQDQNRLIVESLSFKGVPEGRVEVQWKPAQFGDFKDVVACSPVIYDLG